MYTGTHHRWVMDGVRAVQQRWGREALDVSILSGGYGLLRVDEVTKRFEGLTAIAACTVDVAEGAIHGMIGPNGAGKTTLFDLISGAQVVD